jgi:hypothetical protein
MKPNLWVPPEALVRKSQRGREVRPFAQLGKQVRELGFEASMRIDESERTIEVRFVPQTERTRQAVKVAAGSSQADALMVTASFGVLDAPGQLALACIEKGIEDLKQVL